MGRLISVFHPTGPARVFRIVYHPTLGLGRILRHPLDIVIHSSADRLRLACRENNLVRGYWIGGIGLIIG